MNGVAVSLLGPIGPLATEGVLAVFGLASVGIIFALRPAIPEPLAAEPEAVLPKWESPKPPTARDVSEKIDDSRFQNE